MSHTPGPWTAHEMTHFGQPGTGFWNVQPITEADATLSEANAHLIAAAPELLEALKRSRTFVQGALDLANDLRTLSAPMSECLQQLDAAIAKAEGR